MKHVAEMHLLYYGIILAAADNAAAVAAAPVVAVPLVFDVLVHSVGAVRKDGFGGALHRWCGMDTQGNDKASGGHLDGDFLSVSLNHDYDWSCNHIDCT